MNKKFIAVVNLLGDVVFCDGDGLLININCLNRAAGVEGDCSREEALCFINQLPSNLIPEHSQVGWGICDWNCE